MRINFSIQPSFNSPKIPIRQKLSSFSKAIKPYEPALVLIFSSSITYLLLLLVSSSSKQKKAPIINPTNIKKTEDLQEPPISTTQKESGKDRINHQYPTSNQGDTTPFIIKEKKDSPYPFPPTPILSEETFPLWNNLNNFDPFNGSKQGKNYLLDPYIVQDLYEGTPPVFSPHTTQLLKEIVKFAEECKNEITSVMKENDIETPATPSFKKPPIETVKHLYLETWPTTHLGKILTDYPSINTLTLYLNQNFISLLDRLDQFPKVTRLILSHKNTSAILPQSLEKLSHLQELSLSGFILDDSFLKSMKAFKNLKNLSLIHCRWQNSTHLLHFLEKLPPLEKLSINDSWDLSLERQPIAVFSRKYTLSEEEGMLAATHLQDYFLKTTLHSLCLDGCGFLKGIQTFPTSLVLLSLNRCHLSQSSKKQVSHLASLTHLYISNSFFEDILQSSLSSFSTPPKQNIDQITSYFPPGINLIGIESFIIDQRITTAVSNICPLRNNGTIIQGKNLYPQTPRTTFKIHKRG